MWWIQSALVYRTFMTLQHSIAINYLSYVCNIFKSCTILQCDISLDCFCVETLSIATLISPPRWNSGYVHNNLPRFYHHHTPPSHSFSATVPTTPPHLPQQPSFSVFFPGPHLVQRLICIRTDFVYCSLLFTLEGGVVHAGRRLGRSALLRGNGGVWS
jgi:hypothetical protein